MNSYHFDKDLTLQEPLPEESIRQAVAVLRSGRLHRYNTTAGDPGEAALLETEFAAWAGKKYCLACASCGSSIYMALLAAGVKAGDTVLCNAYTLAPVPGALFNAGAIPLFVEIGANHTIDLEDLEKKAALGQSRFLLLSHMRGHSADMDAVVDICTRHNLKLIEDSAHTMGAKWNGKKSGSFGLAGCFSTQTYKHINSGEGGLLVTDDPELIARAIIYSGSYMLYDKHLSRPDDEIFKAVRLETPNYSSRMDNLRAALLRPQLGELDANIERWNERYVLLEKGLRDIPGVVCPLRPEKESYVGSSIQFNLPGASEGDIRRFLAANEAMGLHLKWFGEAEPVGFTSTYESWRYLGGQTQLPQTRLILSTLCDIRIPLTLSLEDCEQIVSIIALAAHQTLPANLRDH